MNIWQGLNKQNNPNVLVRKIDTLKMDNLKRL